MITQEKIDRINELARKSKTAGLSSVEKEEQASLRQEYIDAYKASLRSAEAFRFEKRKERKNRSCRRRRGSRSRAGRRNGRRRKSLIIYRKTTTAFRRTHRCAAECRFFVIP